MKSESQSGTAHPRTNGQRSDSGRLAADFVTGQSGELKSLLRLTHCKTNPL